MHRHSAPARQEQPTINSSSASRVKTLLSPKGHLKQPAHPLTRSGHGRRIGRCGRVLLCIDNDYHLTDRIHDDHQKFSASGRAALRFKQTRMSAGFAAQKPRPTLFSAVQEEGLKKSSTPKPKMSKTKKDVAEDLLILKNSCSGDLDRFSNT